MNLPGFLVLHEAKAISRWPGLTPSVAFTMMQGSPTLTSLPCLPNSSWLYSRGESVQMCHLREMSGLPPTHHNSRWYVHTPTVPRIFSWKSEEKSKSNWQEHCRNHKGWLIATDRKIIPEMTAPSLVLASLCSMHLGKTALWKLLQRCLLVWICQHWPNKLACLSAVSLEQSQAGTQALPCWCKIGGPAHLNIRGGL